ncbi:TRAP transporter small permease [Hoeflea sp. TYP-13]|uniref:TRAP transporter small permease n=1 Tax=Hoeflea sp. TYP-13 TaxID=3230023 RepID=UPI0034C5E890
MKPLETVARRLSDAPIYLASAALFVLMIMTFCDVVLRSAFNAPIEAATELTRILMAILVFSVMPVISGRSEHIAVDLADGLFDRYRLTRLRDGIITLVSGLMLWWPTNRVWVLAERARSYGDVTEYLAIPQYLIGWFIAAATALTALVLVVKGLIVLFKPSLIDTSQI